MLHVVCPGLVSKMTTSIHRHFLCGSSGWPNRPCTDAAHTLRQSGNTWNSFETSHYFQFTCKCEYLDSYINAPKIDADKHKTGTKVGKPSIYSCIIQMHGVITVSILGVVVFVPWQQDDQNVWHHDSKWHFHSWLSLKCSSYLSPAEGASDPPRERKQHQIL